MFVLIVKNKNIIQLQKTQQNDLYRIRLDYNDHQQHFQNNKF